MVAVIWTEMINLAVHLNRTPLLYVFVCVQKYMYMLLYVRVHVESRG